MYGSVGVCPTPSRYAYIGIYTYKIYKYEWIGTDKYVDTWEQREFTSLYDTM